MMYTVYHLPQLKKVGCTNNFERRMKQQDVEPLEEYIKVRTNSIEEASLAEETLRKFYGYKEDSNMTYLEKFRQASGSIIKASNSKSVGWNRLPIGSTKDDLTADLSQFDTITLRTDAGAFEFTKDDIPLLVKKAQKSQYKDFYWLTTNLEAVKNEKKETETRRPNNPCTHGSTIPEFQQIRDWATERGLYAKGDAKTQYLKLQEEAGEVARAILKNDEPEIIDGLGDTLVVLINLAHLAGYKLEDCLASAYDVIAKRKGKMVNGTFIKEEDLDELSRADDSKLRMNRLG